MKLTFFCNNLLQEFKVNKLDPLFNKLFESLSSLQAFIPQTLDHALSDHLSIHLLHLLIAHHKLNLLIYDCLDLQVAELHDFSRKRLRHLLMLILSNVHEHSYVIVEHIL